MQSADSHIEIELVGDWITIPPPYITSYIFSESNHFVRGRLS